MALSSTASMSQTNETEQDTTQVVPVTCNNKKAELYVSKMKTTGKSVGKCIWFESRWLSPPEFENVSGMQAARKWRNSIKYNGKPVGDWLATRDPDLSINPFQGSQEGDNGAKNQTPDNENNDPPSMLTQMAHMAHMIDKMQASIETLSQEVKDQETRHKNTTKELRQTIQQQNARIEELEKQVNTGETVDAQPNRQDEMISLHRKVEAMATTVTNQQKVLEISERSSRAQNIIIVGLQEEKENENIGDKVQHLLKDRLDLQDITIANARRLGKTRQNLQQNPRAILAQLGSRSEKERVMKSRAKLSGSRIFINNDLTPDQQKAEKKLRDSRSKLRKLPEYANKKITIYRGKLHVDREPISDVLLQDLLDSA